MIKPSFRDGVLESIEQVISIVNKQGFRVEIETDDNGYLITYTDRKVIVTFSYTFDIEPGLMDYRLFTLDFSVSGSVGVTRFDNKTFDVIRLIRKEFDTIYTPKKKTIASEKANYGFNRAYQELIRGLKTMDQVFNANDRFYQVFDYLTGKGFDVPPKRKDFDKFIDDLKINHSEVFSEMVTEFLRVDEVVNMMIKSVEVV